MTHEIVSELNDLALRLLNREVDFDLQDDIIAIESKLLDIKHFAGCLLLSKLSLMHMAELGIVNAADPKINGMLRKVSVKSSLDFAPLVTKLALHIRDTAEG